MWGAGVDGVEGGKMRDLKQRDDITEVSLLFNF